MKGRRAAQWRIALGTLVLLIALDIGRSIYARIGDARPYTAWSATPAEFTQMAWPPQRAVPANAPLGERMFTIKCAACHGMRGRGNGPAAASLIPRPRDFTAGFEYKSTPAGQAPTDSDLVRTIRNGLPGSAMPYWRDLLADSEISAVAGYVKTLANISPGVAIAVPKPVPSNAASIARGAELYRNQGCVACHGMDGRLGVPLQDVHGRPVIARDLTAPWTFRGGGEPRDVWLRLTTGLSPSPMPAFATTMTPNQRWDLVNYLASIARRPPWEGGPFGGAGFQTDLVKRGSYLVHAEMCQLCHTQIDPTGIYRDSFALSGGMRVVAYPHGVFVTANLTSDSATGVGALGAAGVARAIRTGRIPGRVLDPIAMPWPFLHDFSDSDALAIGSYLESLPPRYRQRPSPLYYGVIETVIGKLRRGPPASLPTFLTYADGDFASNTRGPSRDLPQRVLVDAQWIVLIAGILAVLLVGPLPRWWATLVFVVVAFVTWALNATPSISFIPPDKIAGPLNGGVRAPPTGNVMAARGYYLFKVASCAFCHQPDGRGGSKVSWRPFGSLWTRNISSDSVTGIGTWSDAEIARAIRSGIARDGHPLHWQGMTWDMFSNWDEEDIRSIVAYVRTLPPVRNRVPPDHEPTANDCPIYTFWLAADTVAGCR